MLINELICVVLKNKSEQSELLKITKERGINLMYEELEVDSIFHPLWGIANDSIALIGTQVARTVSKEKVFNLEDLFNFLRN